MIADTDFNYIIPLQLKFTEEFFEKIELEIITDQEYFDELFSTPQKVDILIVSEDLYSSTMQKHNIGKVFLMTEQNEEEQTADLTVTRLFKYTSIKEIFNEVIGKSSEILNIESNLNSDPQIVVVTSAAGGVGKTTVAMGLGACLAKNYKKVLYLNTEQLQTFQYLLQNSSPISSTEVYGRLMSANELIYNEIKHVIRNEMFSYLPPFKAALMSLGIKSDIFVEIARAAKKSKEYDFIIIDTDTTFDEEKAVWMDMADKVIFVTKQNRASVEATNILVSNINGINNEKYIFICNDFEREKDNSLILSEMPLKFVVNEYIEHLNHYDQLKCTDFSNQTSFQRITYLLI